MTGAGAGLIWEAGDGPDDDDGLSGALVPANGDQN